MRNQVVAKQNQENIEEAIRLILESEYFVADGSKDSIDRQLRELAAKPNIRKILELPLQGAEALTFNGHKEVVVCTAIGLAGWVAWTATDRIRDGENAWRGINCGGNGDDLYVFSILRPIIDELIGKLSLPTIYIKRTKRIIGMMEYANSSHCVFDTRERSSWKSMGAAIPLLALMMKAGTSNKDISSCESYFYYLILARQFSDDALDWKEDATGVGNGGKLKTVGANGNTLVVKWLEVAFEEKVKYQVADEMQKSSRRAIKIARNISCFVDTEFLEELPRYYEEMANRIITKQKIGVGNIYKKIIK